MADVVPPEAVPSSDEPDLGAQVRRGLKWSFAGSAFVRMGTFFSGLVMARLLSPRDFGLYAVGAVALMVTASVNDLGIEPTLVRWPGDLDEVAPTAMTVVMAFSVAIFIGFWFGAPAFARVFHAPDGTNIVRLLSVGLIISGAFTVNSALATRTFRQHVRSSAEAAGMVVTISLTIALAVWGLGAYSLAWGQLAGNSTVSLGLFIWSPARYRPRLHWPTAKRLLKQGLPLAGSGLLAVAILNVDYLIVGSVLGAVPLGLYVLAYNMAMWPLSLFSSAVNKVSIAGFAKLQHDPARLNEAFARSVGAVVATTIPFCVLLAGLAGPAVRVVYGHKWVAASLPLTFLAAMAAIRVAILLATDALVACGRGRMVFALQALWLAALVPALSGGAHLWGIRGVGIGHLVAAGGIAVPAFLFALRRQGFLLRDILGATIRPLIGGACVVAVTLLTLEMPGPDLAKLAVGGIGGLAVYLTVMRPVWMPLLLARRARVHQVVA